MAISDYDAETLQGWIDACSQGAGVAVLQCLQGESPIGFATLSDAEGGGRLAMVLVIVGDDLCEDVISGLEAVDGFSKKSFTFDA